MLLKQSFDMEYVNHELVSRAWLATSNQAMAILTDNNPNNYATACNE